MTFASNFCSAFATYSFWFALTTGSERGLNSLHKTGPLEIYLVKTWQPPPIPLVFGVLLPYGSEAIIYPFSH